LASHAGRQKKAPADGWIAIVADDQRHTLLGIARYGAEADQQQANARADGSRAASGRMEKPLAGIAALKMPYYRAA
jgi:hypothetical protein